MTLNTLTLFPGNRVILDSNTRNGDGVELQHSTGWSENQEQMAAGSRHLLFLKFLKLRQNSTLKQKKKDDILLHQYYIDDDILLLNMENLLT